eukprot:SAG11_NODE_32511_length_283_cov_0.293478_1_plen_27_part_01
MCLIHNIPVYNGVNLQYYIIRVLLDIQ